METTLTAEEYYVKHINGGKPLFDMADMAPYYRWLESQFRPPAVSLDGLREAFENEFWSESLPTKFIKENTTINSIFNFFAPYLSPLSTEKKVVKDWDEVEKEYKEYFKKTVDLFFNDASVRKQPLTFKPWLKQHYALPVSEKKVVEDWDALYKQVKVLFSNFTTKHLDESDIFEGFKLAINQHTLPISDNKEGEELLIDFSKYVLSDKFTDVAINNIVTTFLAQRK